MTEEDYEELILDNADYEDDFQDVLSESYQADSTCRSQLSSLPSNWYLDPAKLREHIREAQSLSALTEDVCLDIQLIATHLLGHKYFQRYSPEVKEELSCQMMIPTFKKHLWQIDLDRPDSKPFHYLSRSLIQNGRNWISKMKNEDKKWKLAIQSLSADLMAGWNESFGHKRDNELTPLEGKMSWRR